MAKKITKNTNSSRKTEKKAPKFGSPAYKKVLTRVSEGTNEKNNPVFVVEFQIPDLKTDWMWLATMPSREKAKRVAKMCRDGLL